VAESFGVGVVGGGEDLGPFGLEVLGSAVVDVSGRVQAQGRVAVDVVVMPEEGVTEGVGVGQAANRSGKPGQYLSVLNCDSL
jgi:hypothetical protein